METKKNILTDFKSALQFITIIPVGKSYDFNPLGMIKFFPVVGIILGSLLVVVDIVLSLFWHDIIVSVLDVLFLVIITGAFHLDGVGDSADGLFSHRSKERALEIMKDSRSGIMGVVAVFFVLALKTGGLYSVKTSCTNFETILILFAIPGLARSSMLFGIRFLNYGRENQGTGLGLFEEKLQFNNFIWILIPAVILLFLGIKGVLLCVVFAITTLFILLFYKTKMGCITGDMLGAMTEICETILFLFAGINII